MNKNIKRVIAMVLAVGGISAAMPATNINLLTTKAYASDENDDEYLDSLDLNDGNGNRIKFYTNSDYNNRVDEDDVDDGETYYAQTSSDTISINTDGPSDKYVRIFKGTSASTRGKEVGDDIKLSTDSVTTTFVIKVYSEEPDDDIRYEDNDNYDVLSTYRIKVKYIGDTSTTTNTTITTNNNDTIEESDTVYDDIFLERLSISGSMINLSESQTKYVYDVDDDMDEVTIRATPEDDDYDITIDGEDADESDMYKVKVELNKGSNEIQIKIEDNKKIRVYTLIINRGTASLPNPTNNTSTNQNLDADDYDDIYLTKLSINGDSVNLSEDKIKYIYNVDDTIEKVKIKAAPRKTNYDVTINNKEVDSDDNYQTTVALGRGENQIKIELEDDDNYRLYTLIVNSGNTSPNNADTSMFKSQWIFTNGFWQYNDATGNAVKNTWIQNYYLKADGNMATEWLNINGVWYYFGADGSKKIGWQKVSGAWYYLDSEGRMKTGWIKHTDGKYYYLFSNGSMAYNTTIDGYKLGTNGAWIGR